MKLPLDQTLSFKLIDIVGTAFPNSKHVRDLGVTCVPDAEVWSYAQSNEVTSCQVVCGESIEPLLEPQSGARFDGVQLTKASSQATMARGSVS